MDAIETWLALNPDPAADPARGMAEAGLLAPVPKYAGIARMKAAIVEQTGLLGLASVWGGRHLVFRHFLSFGTDAQRTAWAGRALAVAISEPEVGAHPKKLTTRADRTSSGFHITGRKAWVTNGPSADAIVVFAITEQTESRKRYSAFIVPRDTPGLVIEDMPGFHALRPSRHCLLTLDCHVPETALLGEPGSAYERMALPFRDIEDAVGTFATLGALRHATRAVRTDQAVALGEIVALTAVFAAAADVLVAALDAGPPDGAMSDAATPDAATLAGLRVLSIDITARLRALTPAGSTVLDDLDATQAVARGPRLMRLTRLAETIA
ncbi:MAG TPA: acyl-CoA dehydrogenase family protein [Rhodopila sp.]|nr:acyl-CoA dehydrogenase family protein [Rhodopila sp.]